MPSIDDNTPLRLSLVKIKETGFSLKPDLRDSDLDRMDWMIGFRPIISDDDSQIAVEVRSTAVLMDTNSEVAACSVMLTFNVEALDAFATKESGNRINVNDHLMLNMLNPAYGTLRGVMFARFSGTPLDKKPLPLIDVLDLLKAAKKNEAIR